MGYKNDDHDAGLIVNCLCMAAWRSVVELGRAVFLYVRVKGGACVRISQSHSKEESAFANHAGGGYDPVF